MTVDVVTRVEIARPRADVADFVNAEVRRWVDGGVLRLTPESGADGFTAFVLNIAPHAT